MLFITEFEALAQCRPYNDRKDRDYCTLHLGKRGGTARQDKLDYSSVPTIASFTAAPICGWCGHLTTIYTGLGARKSLKPFERDPDTRILRAWVAHLRSYSCVPSSWNVFGNCSSDQHKAASIPVSTLRLRVASECRMNWRDVPTPPGNFSR
ncbi:hypothetical protein BV22DRAFT_118440 [Leucogyrophana mollusca]|uniref:Uncharacterized protein n=1 Tax=Leucogyrophana mollusca TaxID=85980 RepID=A0ACB8BU59_9AGAM|nr:hypothetical protein BV22DRAFT_118440 [Leucogyrophana mollusca]